MEQSNQVANDDLSTQREERINSEPLEQSPSATVCVASTPQTVSVASSESQSEKVKQAISDIPSTNQEDVDVALAEASTAFRTELSKDYLIPTFVSIPPDASYEGRYFRYNLDCLMSELDTILEDRGEAEDVRKGHQGLFKNTQRRESYDMLRSQITRFGTILKKYNDDKLISKIFVALFDKAPRPAWWLCSSPDWIGVIDANTLSTRHILDMSRVGAQKWLPPFLPIASVYNIARDALAEAEDGNNYDIPTSATSTYRIAKYLYLTVLEAIRLSAGDNPGPAHQASIRQCEKKLRVIYTCLDESVGEGDDFLEMILSQMGNIGPDGQKLSVASIKRSLGGAFGTSHIGKIIGLIPTIMANANSPEAAKKALLESPLVKKMGTLGDVDIDKFLGVFQSMGIMGHASPTPTTEAASSSAPSASAGHTAPKVRKSMAK